MLTRIVNASADGDELVFPNHIVSFGLDIRLANFEDFSRQRTISFNEVDAIFEAKPPKWLVTLQRKLES